MVNVEELVNDVSQALRAYYGGTDEPEDDWHGLYLLEKDRAEASEEYVRELSAALKQANERAEESERLADKRLLQRQAAKKRAQSAEARKVEAEERAEAAEADRDWYRSVVAHNADAEKKAEDAKEDAEKLAEAAINEMHETERFAAAMRDRAEKAEARVKELEREYYLTARSVGFGWQIKANRDTFTAPDGRVFRVGQRVQDVTEGDDEFATVLAFAPGHGYSVLVRRDAWDVEDWEHPGHLRRVWDGSEEPDVPVGTVLRDAEGFYLKKNNFGWQLWHRGTAKWTTADEWFQWDNKNCRPYVEVLDGDDG